LAPCSSNNVTSLKQATFFTHHDIEYDEQASSKAEENIDEVIDDAIENGVWSEENNIQFMAVSSLCMQSDISLWPTLKYS